jgi:hypothetical protein
VLCSCAVWEGTARPVLFAAAVQVWDHIFLGKPAPTSCAIPADLLSHMRREFEYWYPFDLRVSGKVRPSRCGLGLTVGSRGSGTQGSLLSTSLAPGMRMVERRFDHAFKK